MPRLFSHITSAFFILLATVGMSSAQTSGEKTILVLDASGSMWGQIDGEAKITIAQRVIGELLEVLPEGQQLGLTAYGHREKGNCQDIETLVMPGPDTRQAIADAVNAISPKGKTPLSAAVIAAAEQLRYEEEKATVILISDGIETCNYDPCAVGEELEASGVDFTAHVVGFDVSDPLALAQLQCLAENTGGRFITATNASELAEALVEVSVVVEPEPIILDITINARDGEGGNVIREDLVWTLTNLDSDEVLIGHGMMPDVVRTLAEGAYFVEVLRPDDEAFAELNFNVTENSPTVYTLILPITIPAAAIDSAASAVAGSTLMISWTGPTEPRDYITVAEIGSGPTSSVNYTYIREGTTLGLLMPPIPGDYEIRYINTELGLALTSNPIKVTEVTATLDAPAVATVGNELVVAWDGPDYKNDYIAVSEVGAGNTRYVNYTYTHDGAPLTLEMPSEAGVYELRYVMHQDNIVLARQTLTVEAVSATLIAPETATAGEDLVIEWEGPDYQNDYISVAEIGSGNIRYVNYTYTREGNVLKVEMPSDAGTYELRYVMHQGSTILTRQTITIQDVVATLNAPDVTNAGQDIVVEWQGPNYKNDYISVAEIGSANSRYINYSYTREGEMLKLEMPSEAGQYEIRYVMNQDDTILVRKIITVEAVSATLTAPDTAKAGASLVVSWEGPDYKNDYISVAEIGSANGKYINYSYTREGNILKLEMPADAGTYEIRYVQNQDDVVLARHEIVLEAVTASLTLPADASAGDRIIVIWDGPDYKNDYISLAEIGSGDSKYVEYTYTRDGSPLQLQMPGAAGDYEIRYVQNQGDIVLARQNLTVSAAVATIKAPESGANGESIVVEWTGPAHSRDYIAISLIGDDDGSYETYEYVRGGSPLLLEMPAKSGNYELRYVMHQDKTVLVRVPIRVGP